ncbi:2-dehydropantoate 2-reductase [archaeon]|nr:2-dehydropantoate 2-reductase [archaeon]
MRIAIIGAGAIGLAFTKILSKKHDVLLVCRRKEQAKALKQFIGFEKLGKISFFILATKAYDAENALSALRKHYPSTPVLAIQNGLISFHDPNVIQAVTTFAATKKSDTKSKLTADGKVFLTKKNGSAKIIKAFNEAGIDSTETKNIGKFLWEKFFINLGINALGATTGKRNGELVTDPVLRERMRRAVGEAVLASETNADPQNVFHRVVEVALLTSKNKCSMLQDVEARRKTEIDFLNGSVVKMGEKIGLDMHENKLLTEQVKLLV